MKRIILCGIAGFVLMTASRPVSISNFNPIAENRSSLASYAYAIEPMTGPASISRPKGTCRPDAGRLDGICGDVYLKTRDTSSTENYAYAYERKIYDAACVDFQQDTPNEARAKIQNLFREEMGKALACNAANFQVARGSILKYAIEMGTFVLIDSAAKSWKVDLNYVDSSDKELFLILSSLKFFRIAVLHMRLRCEDTTLTCAHTVHDTAMR